MQGELRCTINGVVHAIDSFSSEPLLFFLRDKIGLDQYDMAVSRDMDHVL